MGLLDQGDAQGLLSNPDALLALAAGLFGGKKGDSFGAIGQALMGAQQAGMQSQDRRTKQQMSQMQIQQMQMQLQEAQRQQAQDAAIRNAGAQAFSTGQLPPDQSGPPAMPGGGWNQFATSVAQIDPMKAVALQQALLKESPFGKVDPEKFTSDSIARFMAQGGRDFSLLQPRVKMEAVNTGGSTQFVNPFSPGGPIQHNLSPADQQRLPIERAGLGVRIAEARDQGIGGLPGIPGQGFVTGPSPGVAPMPQQAPRQSAPQPSPQPSPQYAPQTPQMPGMSPKQVREVATKRTEDMPADNATYQNTVSSLGQLSANAKQLLNHPGLAGITGGMSAFPNMPGSNASNAAALLDTLKNKVAFGALQAMRDASKTGGALGSVSDQEGKRLENSMVALSNAQSLTQFKAELAKIQTYSDLSIKRMEGVMKQKYGPGFLQQSSAAPGSGERPPLSSFGQ